MKIKTIFAAIFATVLMTVPAYAKNVTVSGAEGSADNSYSTGSGVIGYTGSALTFDFEGLHYMDYNYPAYWNDLCYVTLIVEDDNGKNYYPIIGSLVTRNIVVDDNGTVFDVNDDLVIPNSACRFRMYSGTSSLTVSVPISGKWNATIKSSRWNDTPEARACAYYRIDNVTVTDAVPVKNDDFVTSEVNGEKVLVSYTGRDSNVTIPEGITVIGENVFAGKESIISVSLPSSLKTISQSAFSGAVNLKTVKFSEGLQKIGSNAFLGCKNLTGLKLPGTLTSIGDTAFQGCTALGSLTIPASVSHLGERVFFCSKLSGIAVADGNPYFYSAGCNCVITRATNKLVIGTLSTVIPAGVTAIGEYAFYYYEGLRSVSIPEGVTEVGGWAFENCTGLTSVALPTTLKTIGYEAFAGTGLGSIAIPAGVIEIKEHALGASYSLVSGCWAYNPGFVIKSIAGGTAQIYASTYGLGFVISGEVPAVPGTVVDPGTAEPVKPEEPEQPDTPEVPEEPETPDVKVVSPGDVNADEKINTKDVVLLKRYAAGWNVSIDKTGADVNGDGKINTKDVVILSRYVAGWNVELGNAKTEPKPTKLKAVINGEHFVGDELSAEDFTVIILFDDGSRKINPEGWTADRLLITDTKQKIVVAYKGISTDVILKSSFRKG